MMRHPPENAENFEFNIGKAPDLRCVNDEVTTTCSKCESCRLRILLAQTREWFPRAGEHTKRRFVLGLVRRFQSASLLQYVIMILKPLIGKDYTYARSRPSPGIAGDRASMGCDRALRSATVDEEIRDLWVWFREAKYWSKANYMLGLLQLCDGNLLHTVGTQARTMLTAELKAAEDFNDSDDEDDNESLADTVYSYNTWDHPENNLLRQAAKEYSEPKESLFTIITPAAKKISDRDNLDPDHVKVEDEEDDIKGDEVKSQVKTDDDDDDSDSVESSDLSSVDPRLSIMPSASPTCSVKKRRSAILGIKPHVDFIRDLPIHISKYILSHLEYAELVSCFDISHHWAHVARSVEEDHRMRQTLWEEVMLMQGSSAKGGNPVYASYVNVPVPELVGDSYDPLMSDTPPEENVQFKNEINIHNSYSGLVTRDISIEERNVYCGAYNVMVLSDQMDFNRVVHFNFGQLVPVGSFDRHVRLVDISTGHETGPCFTGHAGSVKCVFINEARGFLLSGSYDISIRCWDIKTGKPKKIFHGHQATIMCMDMYEDILVSGAKDSEVKVWNFNSAKCYRTYKHSHQINAVAIHGDVVVSGCEGGRVKVWSIENARLIKVFYHSPKDTNRFGFPNPHTHQGPITSVKLDQYHIVSGSCDGYAMVWSTQGLVNKCISALRHPKAVLCVGMAYLRLVTGCEDGKIRIWNMLSGDCLRVMRGNSRSDPIIAIYPCGERLVLLTVNNLLVLNFEKVQWDYEQEEKVERLRYHNHYGDAPLRKHNYAYVRAQRSERAGTANPKIIHHRDTKSASSEHSMTTSGQWQLPHSARTLSASRINSAKQSQRTVVNVQLTNSLKGSVYHNVQGCQPEEFDESMKAGVAKSLVISRGKGLASFMAGLRPPSAATHRPPSGIRTTTTKTRTTATKTRPIPSGTILSTVAGKQAITGPQLVTAHCKHANYGQSSLKGSTTVEHQLQTYGIVSPKSTRLLNNSKPPAGIMRCGISLPCQTRPDTAESLKSVTSKKTKCQLPVRGHSAPVRRQATDALSLSEAKALMRSHRRTHHEPTPRDKLLLTVNCIESSKQDTNLVSNTSANSLEINYKPVVVSCRSSLALDIDSKSNSKASEADSMVISRAKLSEIVTRQTMVTPFEVKEHDFKAHQSLHPKTVNSRIPRGNLVRPKSTQTRVIDQQTLSVSMQRRSNTAQNRITSGQLMQRMPPGSPLRKSQSTSDLPSAKHKDNTYPCAAVPIRKKKTHGWSTSHTEPVVIVPMYMHGASRIEPAQGKTLQGVCTQKTKISKTGSQRKVEDPLRITSDFQIRTREQTKDYIKHVTDIQARYKKDMVAAGERNQHNLWLAMATGNVKNGINVKTRDTAPEIRCKKIILPGY